MPIPVTGTQDLITAGDYTATITELGAGLRELRYQGCPAVSGYSPGELPPGAAGQILAPWPNRIDRGRYRLAGVEHQLDLSEPGRGNAIHGLARWMPWALVRHTASEAELTVHLLGRTGYPFCLELTARYRLCADTGLSMDITARNTGHAPAPYGAGFHPYLTVGPAVDECELTLPCSHWLPADDRGIPAGVPLDVSGGELDFRTGRRIGGTRLDHAFCGLSRDHHGRAWARLASDGTVTALWSGPGLEWLQVFTSDTLGPDRRRQAVAIEPMTCPPNAFVTRTDLIILEPGAAAHHSWGILAGP